MVPSPDTAETPVPLFDADPDAHVASRIARARRRLRRVLVWTAVVLFAGWSLWWWDSARMLRAELSAARSRGEPVSAVELKRDSHGGDPTGLNGADLLNDAVGVLTFTAAQAEVVYGRDRRFRIVAPLSEEDLATALEAEAANGPAIERVAQLADTRRFDMPAEQQRRLSLLVRRLTDFLRMAALAAQQDGRHDAAVARVADMLAVADTCERAGTMGGHMAACVAYSAAADLVVELAPDLHLEAGSADAQQHVRRLVDRLADDAPMAGAFSAAIDDERAARLDNVLHKNPGGILFGAAMRRDAAYFSSACSALRRAAAGTRWRDMDAAIPHEFLTLGDHVVRPGKASLRTQFEQAAIMHFRAMTDRRAAAMRLALRLHELASGRQARRLSDVVPAYIAAVPVDVFDPAGGPLRYSTAEGIPRIYSVDVDGADQGGLVRIGMGGRTLRWRDLDAVYPLIRLRGRTASEPFR